MALYWYNGDWSMVLGKVTFLRGLIPIWSMIQPRFTPVFAPQIAQYCAEEWCQCIHIFAQGDFDCIDGGRKDVIENVEVDGDVEASDDDQQLEKDWCIEPRCSSLSCSTLTQSCPGRRTMSTDVAPPHFFSLLSCDHRLQERLYHTNDGQSW